MYLGDFPALQSVDFFFNTHDASGAPITLADTPQVGVYKDNSATGTIVGPTLTVDFDSTTGLHQVRIATSDAFYAAAHDYTAVLLAGTVDGVSVAGAVLAQWSIANRQAIVNAPATVGPFPAAALAAAPTGSTITVAQTAAVGSITAFNLETTQYGSPSLPITCSVSQQGDGHKFAIYPLDDFSTPTVTLGSSLCSVGASPYTTVTVALDDAYTATAGVFSYILRNTTDDIDAARGTLRIRPASNLTST